MLQLFGGLVLLIAGAQLLVRCAEHIASKLKVRPLLVGLTVVAMGSSAPQMTVSLQAALNDTAD
ncbi:MAG: conjugal transfer protein TraR, partial [Pseudomonas sp.]|nr:conjugal transfer protein TraR [Pseudomonas sp.]